MIIPNLSRKNFVSSEIGRNEKRTCEPSRGGIGSKLKKAKKRLIEIIAIKKSLNCPGNWGKNFNKKPKEKAKKIFAKGPAIATFKFPYFWSRKL